MVPSRIYIQSAQLNGTKLETPFFTHQQLVAGGVLELTMGATTERAVFRGQAKP